MLIICCLSLRTNIVPNIGIGRDINIEYTYTNIKLTFCNKKILVVHVEYDKHTNDIKVC